MSNYIGRYKKKIEKDFQKISDINQMFNMQMFFYMEYLKFMKGKIKKFKEKDIKKEQMKDRASRILTEKRVNFLKYTDDSDRERKEISYIKSTDQYKYFEDFDAI